MNNVYIIMKNNCGIWGSDLVCFEIPKSSDVTELDIVNELRFASEEVKEDLEYAIDICEEADIHEMILNKVFEKLGTHWHYVRASEFEYEIECC